MSWNNYKLSDLLEVKHGFAFEGHAFRDHGKYIVLTPGNFAEEGGFRYRNGKEKYYNETPPANYVLRRNDLLVAMTEQAAGLLGSSILIPEDDKFLHNQRLGLIEILDTKVIEKHFLYHLFNFPDVRKQISISAAGTKVRHTSPDKIQQVEVVLPPLEEQRKIADILTCWDKAIELVDRLIEEKRQLKRAWSQRLLIGKYHLGAENEGSKWKTLSAEEIFTVRSERKHGDKPVLSVTQDQGVVIRNSLDRRIAMTESDPNNFKLVRKGDFVISLRSFQGGLECSDIEGIVSPAYHVIYPKIPISQSYFRHLFKSYWFIGHLAMAVIGIRDGKQISFQDFEFMELPFPPIEEQERIGRLMDALDVEQSLLNEQLNALTDQKRGLMQRLLTPKPK